MRDVARADREKWPAGVSGQITLVTAPSLYLVFDVNKGGRDKRMGEMQARKYISLPDEEGGKSHIMI